MAQGELDLKGDRLVEPIVGLREWLEANAFGYWIKPDGSISYSLFRPTWWQRLIVRITDGERWVSRPE